MGHLVEVVAKCPLQETEIDHIFALGDAYPFTKSSDALWRKAPTAQSTDGRHAGIIPPVHDTVFNQFEQLALGHDGVVQVEPCEFNLPAGENLQCGDEPLVKGAVHLEFKGAQ